MKTLVLNDSECEILETMCISTTTEGTFAMMEKVQCLKTGAIYMIVNAVKNSSGVINISLRFWCYA